MVALTLNLRHLGLVSAIARRGSLTAAAAAAHLTQSAMTQAVKSLEQKLSVTLFERSAGGMLATPAATVLIPRIDAAIAHVASPRVTMAQLRALIALASAGSYGAASLATGLSPPSLHRAVGDLAIALGERLVERRGRGLMLTTAGLRRARAFRLALAELDAGLAELAALGGVEGGTITIGAMPLARARLLPRIIAAFHREHPAAQIRVFEGAHAELIEALRDGALDLVVGALRTPSPGTDVVQTALFVDRPVVVARAEHPLARAAPTVAALAHYPWIVALPGTPLRLQWEALFDGAGVARPHAPIECGSVITIRGILLDTDFLTLLSPDQIAVELEARWLATLSNPPVAMTRTIGLTMRSDWSPTGVQRRFIALAAALARSG